MSTLVRMEMRDGELTVLHSQDIEPILERNKALQAERQRRAGSWHHLGTIPNVILVKWMSEEGADVMRMGGEEFGRFIKKKLRDPDNKWLRATDRRF